VTEAEPPLPEHSIFYELYFNELNQEIKRIYAIAEEARLQGIDPVTRIEVPPAHDVAARVEATLDGPIGVAKRIRELQKDKSREDVAFAVAKEIALGDLGGIDDKEKAADKAVRVALAILTESITAAPLEGIAKVMIRGDGPEKYLALYLAGPIRAAGGTEAAVTVLVADYVRQVLQLPPLKSTPDEVERALEEVELYARAVHLQYSVHPDLIREAASNLPIMLTGDPTEEFEVSGSRDLPRIETNRVRGGAVLVLNDGVVGRAVKLSKIVNRVKISGWEWLDKIAAEMSKSQASKKSEQIDKLAPKSEYLADVIGGRPVFSHPSRIGGFRLRYGRSRDTGLAGVGVHPATMHLVNNFLAPGTHIRTERPGKGSIVAPVDSIEGPIVLLRDGSVLQVENAEKAKKLAGKVKRILYLGDILVALGEFLENNHPLVPSGYCEEWWSHDLDSGLSRIKSEEIAEKISAIGTTREYIDSLIQRPLTTIPDADLAIKISTAFSVPLHPRHLYRWSALTKEELQELRKWIFSNHSINEEGKLEVPNDKKYKRLLEHLGIPHKLTGRRSVIEFTDPPNVILIQLGKKRAKLKGDTPLQMLNSVSQIELRDRLGFSVGARMGRPEKAEERKMRPPIHVLFPVGRTISSERNIEKVAKSIQPYSTLDEFADVSDDNIENRQESPSGQIEVELVSRFCVSCNTILFESRCPNCGSHTQVQKYCSHEGCGLPVSESSEMCPRGHDVNLVRGTRRTRLDIRALLDRIKIEINEPQTYDVRGVLGLTSELKIPEYLGKGVLRAKHDVYCYRDGTARFDATDAPLTHFIPEEIGVTHEELLELGYLTDTHGNPLVSDKQIVELKVQDLVIPDNCADYLLRVGAFVDDCLEKIYKLDRFYNLKSIHDLLGQLVIGLAPHTSAGIVGRIIGFTNASVCYAHPYWHAAKRRNCDGDEDSVILVLDALLNFSKFYLPAGRGGFMDAPLVLSVILNPREVDDESHNMEICSRYPAHFYELVAKAEHPKTVEKIVDIVANRLGTAIQYEGFSYTHETSSIHNGPKNTKYKLLGSMAEKLEAQLNLAILIDAVDARDVAERVLSNHFLRDIRGNLRAYSTQKIQCLKCHRVYRRIPLSGLCICGSKLSLTVRQRNISKYLEVAESIIREHGLDDYLKQRLRMINSYLDSLFVSEQTALTDFFNM